MSNHHLQPNQSDSTSLWNYTLNPCWTLEEVEVLKIALIKIVKRKPVFQNSNQQNIAENHIQQTIKDLLSRY